ncbi:MAG: hypothetical protein K6G30_01955 [Acetatifactor sp.]|nr:hypothetical protein [Acetatifactor sp.]
MKAKKLLTIAGITCFVLATFFSPTTTVVTHAAAPTEYTIQSDILEWRYLFEGNAVYKRLYNASSGNWVGDWIFVRYL